MIFLLGFNISIIFLKYHGHAQKCEQP